MPGANDHNVAAGLIHRFKLNLTAADIFATRAAHVLDRLRENPQLMPDAAELATLARAGLLVPVVDGAPLPAEQVAAIESAADTATRRLLRHPGLRGVGDDEDYIWDRFDEVERLGLRQWLWLCGRYQFGRPDVHQGHVNEMLGSLKPKRAAKVRAALEADDHEQVLDLTLAWFVKPGVGHWTAKAPKSAKGRLRVIGVQVKQVHESYDLWCAHHLVAGPSREAVAASLLRLGHTIANDEGGRPVVCGMGRRFRPYP